MRDMRKQAGSESVEALIQNIIQNIPQFAENTDNADTYTDTMMDSLSQSINANDNPEELSVMQEQIDEALEKMENIEYAMKIIRSTIERKSESLFDKRF
jgi:DNA repair ATPase RecN